VNACGTCGAGWTTPEGAAACCVCPQCGKPKGKRRAFCSAACAAEAFMAENRLFRERDRSGSR
jgi:hypothetical protein